MVVSGIGPARTEDTMTTMTNKAPAPAERVNGINWDSLGYATEDEARKALSIILSGTNSVHGNARAHLQHEAQVRGYWWVRSHSYNSNHPTY
jgi:formylmethanofuran dehydrogenase subunit B